MGRTEPFHRRLLPPSSAPFRTSPFSFSPARDRHRHSPPRYSLSEIRFTALTYLPPHRIVKSSPGTWVVGFESRDHFRASAHTHMTPHPSPHGPSSRAFHPSCSRDPAAASVPQSLCLCHFILFERISQTFPFNWTRGHGLSLNFLRSAQSSLSTPHHAHSPLFSVSPQSFRPLDIPTSCIAHLSDLLPFSPMSPHS